MKREYDDIPDLLSIVFHQEFSIFPIELYVDNHKFATVEHVELVLAITI